MLFRSVEQWAEHEHFSYIPVLSEPDEDWQGRSGFVHQAVMEDINNIAQYDVYAAGPPIMVSSARSSFLEAGLPETQIFHDAFEWALD